MRKTSLGGAYYRAHSWLLCLDGARSQVRANLPVTPDVADVLAPYFAADVRSWSEFPA